MSILSYEHAHAGKVSEQDAKSYLAWGRTNMDTLMGAFCLTPASNTATVDSAGRCSSVDVVPAS